MDGFLEMGGYGAYVWPAYAVSAATLAGLAIFILRRAAKARKRLSALLREDAENPGD
jgi:heme exporter protein D